MTVTFESLPGNGDHRLDGPQPRLAGSSEVNGVDGH
jgi:hypothetical protein